MKIIRLILFIPITLIYGFIITIRNFLFDIKVIKSHAFNITLIGVGNLSTGGSGKTPHAEYLISLLKGHGYQLAYLSRGYKRKTKGFVLADKQANATLLGDEAFQIYQKFNIPLAVCEDRVNGVQQLLQAYPELDCIILDDAFQHRKIQASLNILITPFDELFSDDFLLPSGNLREPARSKKRADMIIVSKTDAETTQAGMNKVRQKLKPAPHTDLFFSGINYHRLYHNHEEYPLSILQEHHVLLFSGIGNTAPMKDFIEKHSKSYQVIKFPDHHNFTSRDMEKVLHHYHNSKEEKKILLTTEKDYFRIRDSHAIKLLNDLPLHVLPISVRFLNQDKELFDEKILEHVKENKRKR